MGQLRRKAIELLAVLLAVSFLTFLLTDLLPGGPEIAILGANANEETMAEVREELRLDDPFPVRYGRWLGDALQGDLGESYVQRRPVADVLGERLPTSLELMAMAQVMALAVAVPLGIFAASRANGWADKVSNTVAFGLLSVPNFILAVLLIFLFSLGGFTVLGLTVGSDFFPATGRVSFGADPIGHFKSLMLPAVALAAGQVAVYMRLLRTEMVATLQEDFIAVARAKGMPPRRILLRHAFRPSSFSLLTVVGINVGQLIGGAVIVESIFVIPGLGDLLVRSIFARDYLVIQGAVLVVAVGFVLVNFLVDLLYSALDPRVRHAPATS